MTFSDELNAWLKETLLSVDIVSPRFSDYKITDVQISGLSNNLEDSINEIIDEKIKAIIQNIGGKETTTDLVKQSKGKKINLEQKGVQYASKGLDIANNPERLLMLGMRYLPHTVLIAFAARLAPFVFEYLTKPGGDLDLRLKIYLRDEFNAFLTRQTQKDTEMGVRQVIIQSKIGFTAANGVNNYNTLRGIREGGINKERMDRIKMVDHAKGLF